MDALMTFLKVQYLAFVMSQNSVSSPRMSRVSTALLPYTALAGLDPVESVRLEN